MRYMEIERTAKPGRGMLKKVVVKQVSYVSATESVRAEPEQNGNARKLLITNIVEWHLGRPLGGCPC